MKFLMRMLLRLVRFFDPWRCPECGRLMQRVDVFNLDKDIVRKHKQAGTLWMIVHHCWHCQKCHDPKEKVIMIM